MWDIIERESLPSVMAMTKRRKDIRRGAFGVLVVYETEAVKFLRVLVCRAVSLDEQGGDLHDGALREVVAIAEGVTARGHDFSSGKGDANRVEALGFMDKAFGMVIFCVLK
jgi:hypothetical protein